MSKTEKKEKEPFYLSGRTIFKRPIEKKDSDGAKRISIGFPICEVSQYADPETVLKLFNYGAK